MQRDKPNAASIDGFGLGITVFKIESKNTVEPEKARRTMKNLENPAFLSKPTPPMPSKQSVLKPTPVMKRTSILPSSPSELDFTMPILSQPRPMSIVNPRGIRTPNAIDSKSLAKINAKNALPEPRTEPRPELKLQPRPEPENNIIHRNYLTELNFIPDSDQQYPMRLYESKRELRKLLRTKPEEMTVDIQERICELQDPEYAAKSMVVMQVSPFRAKPEYQHYPIGAYNLEKGFIITDYSSVDLSPGYRGIFIQPE